MRKEIRISTFGAHSGYRRSLVPRIIESLGYTIEWSSPKHSDLIIFGPFYKNVKKHRFIPKPLRPLFKRLDSYFSPPIARPLTIFHTGENLRHNQIHANFSLSNDLAVDSSNHLRLPYWLEAVDWSHEGISGVENPRFGRPIDLKRLMEPLGNAFLRKPLQAAIFTSHMREPRETLFRAVANAIPVQGFGPHFDKTIENHNSSNFLKYDVLKNFAFNLCPENEMYPGYHTEKIPEAFMADCLPLTWIDTNVSIDFNPNAFINLAPMMQSNFSDLHRILHSRELLEYYASQPLVTNIPTLEKHIFFVKEIVKQALS